jgi:hypothetical protein
MKSLLPPMMCTKASGKPEANQASATLDGECFRGGRSLAK